MEERKILPLVEEVLAEVYSKLQGKAGQNYEVKLVRLIRDQKSWAIQAQRDQKSAPSYRERLTKTTSRRQLG